MDSRQQTRGTALVDIRSPCKTAQRMVRPQQAIVWAVAVRAGSLCHFCAAVFALEMTLASGSSYSCTLYLSTDAMVYKGQDGSSPTRNHFHSISHALVLIATAADLVDLASGI
uniref:Uncharacterized protein n=1 Tax=Anopheles culicifacies TaxID=139723 RepID=A0A182MI37_9DIPT